MSGPVRPETVLYEPGVAVATKLAEDGGREYDLRPIEGIVLGVSDDVDPDTGEKLGRLFRVLDRRSGGGDHPELIVHFLAERELDLYGASVPSDRELRALRRRLHWMIWRRALGKGKSNQPTDGMELDAEACIALLLRVEVGQ